MATYADILKTAQINHPGNPDAQRAAILDYLVRSQPKYQSPLQSTEFKDINKFAFGTGDLATTKLQRKQADLETQRGLEGLSRDQAGQQANAYTQLATGGGLSSGARERIAQGGASQGLFARQGLRASGAQNLANINLSQEQQRMQAKAGYLDAQAKDFAAKNSAAQDAWRLRADTYAGLEKAKEQTKAAQASGGGGGKK